MDQHSQFHRIRRLPPYVMTEVNQMKADYRHKGVDIIDFGMGNPDQPTPQHIVDKLAEVARDPRSHRYSASRGIRGLRLAIVDYYQRRFGVGLNPETEAIVTLGSKEGLANLAQAITAPGDVILAPNPCYPIHAFGFILAGGSIRHLPLPDTPDVDSNSADFETAFLQQIVGAIRHSVPRPTAIVLNFPANPTGTCVSLQFYQEVVRICKDAGVWILSDLAYAEIYFDAPPPSILEVADARDIAVEFTSLSKTYNMPGWRIGFAVGNDRLIGALARIKSYLDYGAFTPIQVAATTALNGPQDCVDEIRQTYRERRDQLVGGLQRLGWDVRSPEATMFVWAKIPKQYHNLGSLAFTKLLIEQTHVAVAPGLGFGEYGDQYVRFGLVENKHRIRQALKSMRPFLQS